MLIQHDGFGGALWFLTEAYLRLPGASPALIQRADTKDRKAASTLRGEVVAKLNRLREDLADALKDDPSLPADLEAQVFGYLDLLEKNDAEAAAQEKKKALESGKKGAAESPNASPASPTRGQVSPDGDEINR